MGVPRFEQHWLAGFEQGGAGRPASGVPSGPPAPRRPPRQPPAHGAGPSGSVVATASVAGFKVGFYICEEVYFLGEGSRFKGVFSWGTRLGRVSAPFSVPRLVFSLRALLEIGATLAVGPCTGGTLSESYLGPRGCGSCPQAFLDHSGNLWCTGSCEPRDPSSEPLSPL